MKKHLLLILPFLLLFGCKSTKMASSSSETSPNTIFNATLVSPSPSENPYYHCKDFLEIVYNTFTINEIENKYASWLSKELQPTQNIHNIHITDTILSYTSGSNIIKFYQARHTDILFMVELTDSRIALFENIRPGMSKADFQTKFSISHELPNSIKIGTPEAASSFIFQFRRGKLRQISSDLYID
ncbi:MAG: hypothetical protein V2I46_10365 [Bacteroides sp.]|nr:hypothetical protein [Bacteroides sp.]